MYLASPGVGDADPRWASSEEGVPITTIAVGLFGGVLVPSRSFLFFLNPHASSLMRYARVLPDVNHISRETI